MDEIIFNLLLTGRSGLSLPGTLRFRFTDLDAAAPTGDMAAVLAGLPEAARIDVAVFQLAGTLSVPLLTGVVPVPLAGVALATAAGPIAWVFNSSDASRPLRLLFNLLESQSIAGGMLWRPGQFGELAFGLLGTQLPAGLQDQAGQSEEAA